MSQVSAEFIPTRMAILPSLIAAAKKTIPPAIICVIQRRRQGTWWWIKPSLKRTVTPFVPRFSAWIASDEVQVVLITGGTGLTEGDQAPEAAAAALRSRSGRVWRSVPYAFI
ncbi:molybdenum cofactor biosynthesis protein B [Salmonella bongori]|nr:molybdenum cofactor biosynthesis protein B [Salmonella bongori]